MRESAWQWGKLLIGHFNKTSKHSAYSAKGLIDDKGISLVQAHVHRGGLFYKRAWDKQIVGVENYCLCDLNPPYLVKPNWQQGFSLVYRQGDIFHVEPHPILNGRTFFRGQLITA